MASSDIDPPFSDGISPMEVAQILQCPYRKARDLMLSGKLGVSHYESRALTVSKKAVHEFNKTRKARVE